MGGAALQFLGQKHFTPDGLPREGANVTNWGPPENRNRERYLEKYGAKSDDDRNFLSSLSTNATPKKVEQKQTPTPGESLITGKQKTKRKRIYGMGKSQGKEQSGTVKKPTLGGE